MGYQPLPKWKCYIEDDGVCGELIISAKDKQEAYKIAKKTKLYIKWIEVVGISYSPPDMRDNEMVKQSLVNKVKLLLDKVL